MNEATDVVVTAATVIRSDIAGSNATIAASQVAPAAAQASVKDAGKVRFGAGMISF